MIVLILPNLLRVTLDNLNSYFTNGNTVFFDSGSGPQPIYKSPTSAGAMDVLTQIEAAVTAGNAFATITIMDNTTLTWTSVAPDTWLGSDFLDYIGAITGSGFNLLSVGTVLEFQLSNNGLATSYGINYNITSDTNINLNGSGLSAVPVGSYLIYYRTVAGYISTGLTLNMN
jgi:hypothetical protein